MVTKSKALRKVQQQQTYSQLMKLTQSFQIVVALLIAGCGAGTANGQIFVANWANRTIGEYSFSGAPINPALITLPGEGESQINLALGGNGNLYVSDQLNGTVGEYTTSGTAVNASLITGLGFPLGIAVDQNGNIFVTTGSDPVRGNTVIGEYDASGAAVNPALITRLYGAWGIALDGNGHLFVGNSAGDGAGTIGEYTTSGTAVNPSLITGLTYPAGLVLDGYGNLFVTSFMNINSLPGSYTYMGIVGEYTTAGEIVNSSLVTGLNNDYGVALDGAGHLFVTDWGNTIGEYTTSGEVVNASLITDNNGPASIFVIPVPEPSSAFLVALGSALFAVRRMRWRQR